MIGRIGHRDGHGLAPAGGKCVGQGWEGAGQICTENLLLVDPSPQFTVTVKGPVALAWVKLPRANDWVCPKTTVCAAGGVTVMVVTGAATVTANVELFDV